MDVAESTEPVAQAGVDLSRVIGDVDISLDSLGDDGRSSSLSEIDDVSDNEPSDVELPQPQQSVPEEVDSEAETERLEDSPNNHRLQPNIKLTGMSRFESSPSKLAQSTTYDEMEEDEENELTKTPSKTRRSSKPNGASENIETPVLDDAESPHSHADVAGKKRKRSQANEDLDTEMGDDDEPLRKRRGSVGADEIQDEVGGDVLTTREETEEVGQHDASGKGTPLDETPDSAVPTIATRGGKRGVKKGKRKGRRARDTDEDLENGAENTEDQLQEDEETGDVADDANDADAVAKSEEELARKIAAIDALAVLEKEFATLREKIYDERIAKIDRELEQLTSPEPTHPELLRQLECLQRHRDKKINYEHTLYQYRMQSLMSRSLADRAQIHSTYFQRIRDTREKHSTAVSKQFYAIQHDRFKTEELGAHHYIPFPTRRSQQISQQTAYNQEVSVMAGVAKYVGFPAAPTLSAARTTEIDDDFDKMGISVEHRPVVAPQSGVRGGISSDMPRYTAAEETHHEQQPIWANPQYVQANRPAHLANLTSFTTPAAQKRVIDINAPNGSASTIADNASAANSSTGNTPYGIEQDHRQHAAGQPGTVDFDALDRKSGLRSQSSSPLDVRKGPSTNPTHLFEARHEVPTRNPGYSPPRFGLFGASKRESSPPLSTSNKPLGGIHSSGLMTGSGPSRMIAR
uniref:Transcriptional regulatory protein DEP1 n=1 Tax=Talaromyces marneffei PM1 TaxID=1077442 RepID=A0A093V799_TALMA